jgi:hypothetical protein
LQRFTPTRKAGSLTAALKSDYRRAVAVAVTGAVTGAGIVVTRHLSLISCLLSSVTISSSQSKIQNPKSKIEVSLVPRICHCLSGKIIFWLRGSGNLKICLKIFCKMIC